MMMMLLAHNNVYTECNVDLHSTLNVYRDNRQMIMYAYDDKLVYVRGASAPAGT